MGGGGGGGGGLYLSREYSNQLFGPMCNCRLNTFMFSVNSLFTNSVDELQPIFILLRR